MAPVACDAMFLTRGVESTEDIWLANNVFRAVVKHPYSSYSIVGIGGGTVIDAGIWGYGDWLHEVVPLVRGGWLDVEDMELMEDGVLLKGTIASLPDMPSPGEGEPAEVRWRIEPDSNWLHFEGADGLYLHGDGELKLYDGWLWNDTHVYGHDGHLVRDLGGAIRVDGASKLLIADPHTALREKVGGRGTPVSGTATNAQRIVLIRDGEITGLFPVQGDGTFAAVVPADTDWIRAQATGRSNSDWFVPGLDRQIGLAGPGSFEVRPVWASEQRRPIRVDWTSFDGRAATNVLPSTGGTLFLGFGQYTATISAGPAFRPVTIDTEVDGVAVESIAVDLEERFDPGSWVAAGFGWQTDRSRTWRGTDTFPALDAYSRGADYVILAAEDDVADISDDGTAFPQMLHDNGSWTVAADGSWRVLTWPWTRSSHRPAGGAVDVRGLDANDAFAAATGAFTRDRHSVVDLGWLAQAPSPWAVDPRPEAVLLTPPGTEGPAAWSEWFDWLDAGAALTPVGELAWFEVPDRETPTRQDVLQSFHAGRSVATTGPWLSLEVDGAPISEEVDPESTAPYAAIVELRGGLDVDHLALIGTGGTVWGSWPVDEEVELFGQLVDPGRWLIAVAWDDEGTAFAATGPVWVEPPGYTTPGSTED